MQDKAISAMVGGQSCATCPEYDNPDSYIRHIEDALRWHDEHVPRPTNPHATVVVLQGTKVPDEVLFVNDDGSGVTHFTTEKAKATKVTSTSDGVVGRCTCSKCGETVHRRDLYCWKCGRKFE